MQIAYCVFLKEPNGNVPVLNLQTNMLMKDIAFNNEVLKRESKSINKNKSSGPDDIDIKSFKNFWMICLFQ